MIVLIFRFIILFSLTHTELNFIWAISSIILKFRFLFFPPKIFFKSRFFRKTDNFIEEDINFFPKTLCEKNSCSIYKPNFKLKVYFYVMPENLPLKGNVFLSDVYQLRSLTLNDVRTRF